VIGLTYLFLDEGVYSLLLKYFDYVFAKYDDYAIIFFYFAVLSNKPN